MFKNSNRGRGDRPSPFWLSTEQRHMGIMFVFNLVGRSESKATQVLVTSPNRMSRMSLEDTPSVSYPTRASNNSRSHRNRVPALPCKKGSMSLKNAGSTYDS